MTWHIVEVIAVLELTVWLVWLRFRITHRLDKE